MRRELFKRAIFFLLIFSINAWASSHWSFVSGPNYFRTLSRLLSRGNLTHIRIMHPMFRTYGEGKAEGPIRQILNQLIELHRQGTKIEVLLDGTTRSLIQSNENTVATLREAGIAVRLESTIASDVRLIALQSGDSYTVLSGSTDLTNSSLGGRQSRGASNETNGFLSSAKLGKRVCAYFDKAWSGATELRKRVFHLDIHDGTIVVPDQAFLVELNKLIDRAKRRIDLAAYLISLRSTEVLAQNNVIHRLLIKIGQKYQSYKSAGKPFEVRVFVDVNEIESKKGSGSQDSSVAAVQRVLNNYGITEFWYGSRKQVSHQKFVIKDAPTNETEEATLEPEVLFGSSDLIAKSLERRQLNFLSSDRRLVGHFQKYMNDRVQRSTPTPMASNALYYRFFQGFQLPELSEGQFLNRLNRWLIPATPSYSAHNALVGYLPTVLLPSDAERQRPDFIADEVALVAYSSVDDYFDARMADEESQAYGPLHREVFDFSPGLSRSLVPKTYRWGQQVYTGSEIAYDVLADASAKPVDWQTGTSFIRVLTRSPLDVERGDADYNRKLINYFENVRRMALGPGGLQGHVILVHPRYLIEYLNWDLSEEEMGEVAYGAGYLNLPYKFMNGGYRFQKWAVARTRTQKEPLLFQPVLNECAARIVFEARAPKSELGQFVKEELP